MNLKLKINILSTIFCAGLVFGLASFNRISAIGDSWKDFLNFKSRIIHALNFGHFEAGDIIRANNLKNYLEIEGYKVKNAGEDGYFAAEPIYVQYALRVCDYVDKNIGRNASNALSVALYSSMLERTPEEICEIFGHKKY